MKKDREIYNDYIVDEFVISNENIDVFCSRMAEELEISPSFVKLVLIRARVFIP